jgi:serine/threonine protein phosphatase 1
MRVLATGDIHGCTRALDTLLALVNPRPEDQLVFLGDYVDRGPDSRGALDRLLKLRETHQVVALRGNHDMMMLQARETGIHAGDWLLVGGRQTLASYGTDEQPGTLDDVPARHWEFLEKTCVDWHETDTHFFVHANVYPDMELAEQPTYMLHWEKLYEARQHVSGKIMVCGHTSQRSGRPLNLGHAICIDTWVYGQGWLTCLEVATGRIWQANQRGEQHTGWLDACASGD